MNDDELEQYTQGHMLACARQAITWSQEQFGGAIQFHLRGHSEGTLVALFLYEKLLSEEPRLAARHLDSTFRYYEGPHVGGPPEVKRELSDLLVRLTARSPSVRSAPVEAGAELSGER